MANVLNKDAKQLCVLGSTGSIGTQVLDIVRHFPAHFKVQSLSAGKNLSLLARQVLEFSPEIVVIQDKQDVSELESLLTGLDVKRRPLIEAGEEALCQLPVFSAEGSPKKGADMVIIGLVGLTGLKPTLNALKAGKQVLSANKETFVAGGHLVQPHLNQIIPLDSEHSAIFQCLPPGTSQQPRQANRAQIDKILLTASGGPFRTLSGEALESVNPQAALQHPNWVMGQKVTIDSATLMNKGLEVIEAHWLFGVDYGQIEVIIHPQSIIHSGVTFIDGVTLFQLGAPDMRAPIQYGMFYPERIATPFNACRLDIATLSRLDFETPDTERFPCLALAYEAGKTGGSMPAVLNAADEVAVNLFLNGEIGLMDIPRLIEAAMDKHRDAGVISAPSLEDIKQIDAWARQEVSVRSADLPIMSGEISRPGFLSISG